MRFIFKFIHKNWLPKTLFVRFMLIITMPIIIGQMVIIFLFYDRHWYNVSYYTSDMIVNEITMLLNNWQNIELSKQEPSQYFNLTYEFYKGEKLPQKKSKLTDELRIFSNILRSKINTPYYIKLTKTKRIEILFKVSKGVLKVSFISRLLINPTTHIFILWIVCLTVLLIIVSLIFSKKQIKPILDLANAADSFGHGSKNSLNHYKPSGAMEVRMAGIAFLKMKDRIEKHLAKRMQMLAMISHDLRTPLTRMNLQVELLENSEDKIGLKQDIFLMNAIISAYLDFVRGEGGEVGIKVPITKWLSEYLHSQWINANIEIDSTVPDDICLHIKPFSFQRALSNLISNAIKYSSKIKISCYTSIISENNANKQLIIDIEDNGPGIVDAEKNLVFKAFYRSDKSRSLNNDTSVGLGLAITKEIINGHYGDISLYDSKDLGGLLVRITLPI